jgi:ribosomal protein L12E/L44/L45/RPP1/RPP2
MKEVAAYLLCVLGGNESPSASDVTALLKAGGVAGDAGVAGKVCDSANGKVRAFSMFRGL